MATELVLTVRRPPGPAEVHRFAQGPVAVGRGEGCAVRLVDDRISDVQVRFVQRQDRWEVVDPGSRHGSRLGDTPLTPGRPHPLRSADALALGPFLVEVFLDAGGGLTTDSRSTQSRARSLVAEATGEDALWVLSGPGAGLAAPLSRHHPLVVGSGPDCDLVIEGLAPRHFELAFDRTGLGLTTLGGPVRVRGRAVDQARVFAEDHLAAGESVFQVRGGPGRTGWTRLELGAALVLVLSLGLVVWVWFFS